MPADEAFLEPDKDIIAEFKVGDNVTVLVMKSENDRGQLTVSIRRLDYEFAWKRVPRVIYNLIFFLSHSLHFATSYQCTINNNKCAHSYIYMRIFLNNNGVTMMLLLK
jgi:hypothetical protein